MNEITVKFADAYKVNRHKTKVTSVVMAVDGKTLKGRCLLQKDGVVYWRFKEGITLSIAEDLDRKYPAEVVQKRFSKMIKRKALKEL